MCLQTPAHVSLWRATYFTVTLHQSPTEDHGGEAKLLYSSCPVRWTDSTNSDKTAAFPLTILDIREPSLTFDTVKTMWKVLLYNKSSPEFTAHTGFVLIFSSVMPVWTQLYSSGPLSPFHGTIFHLFQVETFINSLLTYLHSTEQQLHTVWDKLENI